MQRIFLALVICLFSSGAFAQGVVQSPNLFWATPLSGTGFLTLRALGSNDLPNGVVGNSALANSSTTVNGVVCTLGSSCTIAGGATFSLPANPGTITSTSGLMLGLAGTITPTRTGNITITISGNASNSTTVNGTCFMTLRHGTGTAPANGAALTGTSVGHSISEGTGVANLVFPFSVTGVITGQPLGTARWIDLQITGAAGTCTITNVNIAAMEQ